MRVLGKLVTIAPGVGGGQTTVLSNSQVRPERDPGSVIKTFEKRETGVPSINLKIALKMAPKRTILLSFYRPKVVFRVLGGACFGHCGFCGH